MQDRLKKRIFCSTIVKNFLEKCEIPLEKKSIPVSVPMFWPVLSSKNIYEINDKTSHHHHNLLRRHFFDGSHPKGAFNGSGYSIYT